MGSTSTGAGIATGITTGMGTSMTAGITNNPNLYNPNITPVMPVIPSTTSSQPSQYYQNPNPKTISNIPLYPNSNPNTKPYTPSIPSVPYDQPIVYDPRTNPAYYPITAQNYPQQPTYPTSSSYLAQGNPAGYPQQPRGPQQYIGNPYPNTNLYQQPTRIPQVNPQVMPVVPSVRQV